MAASPYVYTVSPLSRNAFTLTGPTGTQEMNLERLNEQGLHKVLFIFVRKVDPNNFRDLQTLWDALPKDISTFGLDVNLQKKVKEADLRQALGNLLQAWAAQTADVRNMKGPNAPFAPEKFAHTPEWTTLHSVTVNPTQDMQLAYTPTGIILQPADCAKQIRDLRQSMDEIRATLARCSAATDFATQSTCLQVLQQDLASKQIAQAASRCA